MKKKGLLITAAAVTALSAALFVGCGETHSLAKVEASDPTCGAAGNTEYYKCYDDGCGKVFSDAGGKHEVTLESVTIKALGHTVVGIGDAVSATCTEDGLTAGEKCSVCGVLISERQVVSKTGHIATKVDGTAASCETAGTITHYDCAGCGVSFIDENCTIEAGKLDIKALGHAYGEWTPVGNGKHLKTCANDSSHIEYEACVFGKTSDFDSTGHYLTCAVCGGKTENLPHELKYIIDGNEHYGECKSCDYVSDKTAHTVNRLSVEATGEKLYGGKTITLNDLTVESVCECGHEESINSDDITFEDTLLADGLNTLSLTYAGKAYEFTYNAPVAPSFTLTVAGATFEDGTNTTELKEGQKYTGDMTLVSGKTFLGYRNGVQVFNDISDFAMLDKNCTVTAIYEEDLIVFTPSDRSDTGAEIGAHIKLDNNAYATRYTWTASGEQGRIIARGSKDSGTVKGINVHAPAHKESLMFLYVVNNGDKDVELLYQVENYYVYHGEKTFTVKAHSVERIPFVYGSDKVTEYGQVGTFSTCDHYLTINSEIVEGESVTLDIYGRLVSTENNMLTSITASVGGTFNTFFDDGDVINLSKLTVTGNISGYNVTIPGYTCNIEDGAKYTSDITELKVEFAGLASVIKFNSYDDCIVTRFSKNLNWAGTSTSIDWLSTEYVYDEATGYPATKYMFKAGGKANSDNALWPQNDKPDEGGYNVRIPTYANRYRHLRIFVSNQGTESVSYRLYAENNGAKEGVDITIAGGESKIFDLFVNPGASIGCNYNIKLLQDVTTDTPVVMFAYFKTYEGEVADLSINESSTHSQTFKVGDTFSSKYLTVDTKYGSSFNQTTEVNIANFTTNFDGHVFTADDIGEQTVTVIWNGLTTTYKITVESA